MKSGIKYLLLICIAIMFSLSSCVDDEMINSDEEISGDMTVAPGQYALSFAVTLDDLGGDDVTFNPMKEIENYIDLEKVRVLFFDDQERFLFESKSRWVKQKNNEVNASVWYVSVPFYSYGNDNDDDWDFESIRNHMKSKPFKIALLVNRPQYEYASENGSVSTGVVGGVFGWFDNSAPHWLKRNSVFGAPSTDSIRYIIDLHHCQYDAVYANKGFTSSTYPKGGGREAFYNFVADGRGGAIDANGANTHMGSFTSWVNWEGEINPTTGEPFKENADKKNYENVDGTLYRKMRHPDKDRPIPMYGVQNFQALEDWEDGTTYELNRSTDKPISLLRSCVKVEVVVPKSKGEFEFFAIFYPNIYSRCEPMNVWTPTNEIWFRNGEPDSNRPDGGHICESDAILKYGPVSRTSDPYDGDGKTYTDATKLLNYQRRISWFYGAWKDKELKEGEKRWVFSSLGTNFGQDAPEYTDYPNIFNPMIQRNTAISYALKDNDTWENGVNRHAIIYIGERNVNDPSDLALLGGKNGSCTNSPLMVLVFKLKNDPLLYTLPVTDYKHTQGNEIKLQNNTSFASDKSIQEKMKAVIDPYSKKIMGMGYNNSNRDYMPYPLIRNHVYRLYLQGTTKGAEDSWNVYSEVKASKSIYFPKALKPRYNSDDLEKVEAAKLDTSSVR